LYLSEVLEARGQILAYAFLARQGEGKNRRRLIRLGPGDPPDLEILEDLEEEDLARNLQPLARPMLAQAGKGVFFLRLGARPHILQIEPQRRRLTEFPSGFNDPPAIPISGNRQEDMARWQAVERSSLPVGLFGWGGDLFLLTRRPSGEGRTLWELSRLNATEDRILASIRLPSEAENLLLIPGPKYWIGLERGSRTGHPRKDFTDYFLLSTELLETARNSVHAASCS
jgi:hypothetical protein